VLRFTPVHDELALLVAPQRGMTHHATKRRFESITTLVTFGPRALSRIEAVAGRGVDVLRKTATELGEIPLVPVTDLSAIRQLTVVPLPATRHESGHH
jgi:hypothetical protein